MAQINSNDDLTTWIKATSKRVGETVALRAALRLLPRINLSSDLSLSERERYVLLSAFHALATGWALLAQADETLIEDAQAYFREFHANSDDLNLKAIDACRVAIATESKEHTYVLNSLDAALRSGHSAAFGKSEYGAKSYSERWTNPSWNEILQDIDFFDAGDSFAVVANRRLFSMGLTNRGGGALSSMPLGALSDEDLIEWDRRKQLLLSDSASWAVWTDWYEERIQGAINKPRFNWAIAQLTEQDWRQPPIAVNAQIWSLLEDFAAQIPPATMTTATMAGPMRVFASDRLVSVRDNQEPFDNVARSLDEIRNEFMRDHNWWRFNFRDYDETMRVIEDTLSEIESGHVRRSTLESGLLPRMILAATISASAVSIAADLPKAFENVIAAIKYILALI